MIKISVLDGEVSTLSQEIFHFYWQLQFGLEFKYFILSQFLSVSLHILFFLFLLVL